jgi:hypothetical protein
VGLSLPAWAEVASGALLLGFWSLDSGQSKVKGCLSWGVRRSPVVRSAGSPLLMHLAGEIVSRSWTGLLTSLTSVDDIPLEKRHL